MPKVIGMAMAPVLLFQLILRVFGPVVGGGDHPGLSALIAHLVQDGWWKWIVLPFSNSIVTKEVLVWGFGEHAITMQVVLGMIVGCLHILFWWWFVRHEINKTTVFAAFIMIYFYANLAGIIYGRIETFGSDYLNAPRYVLLYQFNIVALLLMFSGSCHRQFTNKVIASTFVSLVCLLLLVQWPLSKYAWKSAPYKRAYYVEFARQIVAMGDDPSIKFERCAPELPPCNYSEEHKVRAIGLLEENNLNVYSAKFRIMHGFVKLSEERKIISELGK